jgi:hypothetical protein
MVYFSEDIVEGEGALKKTDVEFMDKMGYKDFLNKSSI